MSSSTEQLQGSTFRLMLSHHEVTQDHVLQARLMMIFSAVAINAVKESVIWLMFSFFPMFSVFSMSSQLPQCSSIRDGRMKQLVEPCTTYNSECCRNFSAVQSFSLTKNDGFEGILQSGLRASFVQDVCLLTG